MLNVPGDVNTVILLKPPAGIAEGAICGPVINPVICVFATNPVIFADAPKPAKFLLIPI
jgi:hypothetical protein